MSVPAWLQLFLGTQSDHVVAYMPTADVHAHRWSVQQSCTSAQIASCQTQGLFSIVLHLESTHCVDMCARLQLIPATRHDTCAFKIHVLTL